MLNNSIYIHAVINSEIKVNRAKINRAHTTQTLTSAINNSFQIALKEYQKGKKEFVIGQFVLAKMRGYMPWPARISHFTKDKSRVSCYFYGTNNNGSVNVKEMVPFGDGFSTIRLIKLRHVKYFEKGVKEVELEHGIPEYLSSLRETEAIEC